LLTGGGAALAPAGLEAALSLTGCATEATASARTALSAAVGSAPGGAQRRTGTEAEHHDRQRCRHRRTHWPARILFVIHQATVTGAPVIRL
jgi:hypothetical protein